MMDRLAIIASESQRLADVLASTAPDRRCPTCPEWTAADLLWHLTEVHFFWAQVLGRDIRSDDELAAVEQSKPERPTALPEMLTLRTQSTELLIAQLAQRDDTQPCWSWWPADQTVGFTRRMQTYEATMHRVDAELTAGVPLTPIAADVAAGAVDHAVDVMWGWMPKVGSYHDECVVEFISTDTDHSWLVEVGTWRMPTDSGADATGPRAERALHGQPTATVSAPIQDLALWAWTRGGTVEIAGDEISTTALAALIAEGIQ